MIQYDATHIIMDEEDIMRILREWGRIKLKLSEKTEIGVSLDIQEQGFGLNGASLEIHHRKKDQTP